MAYDVAELVALFEDEEDGRIGRIVRVESDRPERRLELLVQASGYDAAERRASVACEGAMRWSLCDGAFDRAAVADDHPALLDFDDDRGDLYFTGAVGDPAAAADALRAVHARTVGRFLEMGLVVNGLPGSLEELLGVGYGRLATGPRRLLDRYALVLARSGVRTSILPVPLRDGLSPPFAVLELGRSWVVAKAFTARVVG